MRRVDKPVPLATLYRRALLYLDGLHRLDLANANCVGVAIWPGTVMTSQGFGGAASRILRRMQNDGIAEWYSDGRQCGWRITLKGREQVRNSLEVPHAE